jgi:hypothetical protein
MLAGRPLDWVVATVAAVYVPAMSTTHRQAKQATMPQPCKHQHCRGAPLRSSSDAPPAMLAGIGQGYGDFSVGIKHGRQPVVSLQVEEHQPALQEDPLQRSV